jgi:16S rRNA (uracil1498-N3)-methyltransferase
MDRDSDRFFYAPPDLLAREKFRFSDDEAHHLVRVLRLAAGSEVTAVDGDGNGAVVRITPAGKGCDAEVVRRLPPEEVPRPAVTLAAALLKGKETESVLERCTEIGIARFVPFVSERTVAAVAAGRGARRAERYAKIALRAMKVARSARKPVIDPPTRWAEIVASVGRFDRAFLCDGRAPKGLVPATGAESVLLLVGPEGGFTEEEREAACRAGAEAVSLGGRNLRASTAAVAACALALGRPPER